MKTLVATLLALSCGAAVSQERDIQRALIQRDQQSAEFAARLRGADTSRLEQLHSQQLIDAGRPLSADPLVARELRPYERQKMADERELRLTPPVVLSRRPPEAEPRPLAIPGGPPLVDPIPAQGPGN
jgi:hypothetical protein